MLCQKSSSRLLLFSNFYLYIYLFNPVVPHREPQVYGGSTMKNGDESYEPKISEEWFNIFTDTCAVRTAEWSRHTPCFSSGFTPLLPLFSTLYNISTVSEEDLLKLNNGQESLLLLL